ncbi:MAG TPA: efflux RND transporter periplasmic adaptor subunit [Pyrinomonadaceae bacterium]|jgi:membrane fusion protein (multidrug efflux system)
MSTVEKDLVKNDKIVSSENGKHAESSAVAPEEPEETIEPEKETEKPRSRVPIYVVAGIILLTTVVGTAWWIYARQFVTTDDAIVEGFVSVISPKISAHVSRIHVKENQLVKKGDLLVEFEAQEQEAKLEQARARLQTAFAARAKAQANVAFTRKTSQAGLKQAGFNLEAARSNIEQTRLASDSKQNGIERAQTAAKTAEANFRQMQAQIPAAEAALAQAKALVPVAQNKLEVARIEHDRDRQLFDAGDVSKQKLEQSNKELNVAQGELTSAEKQVDIAASRLEALRRSVEVERSRMEEARIGIAAAENDFRQSQAQINLVSSQADESAGRLMEAKALPEKIAVDETDISAAEAEAAQAQAAVNQAEVELGYTKIYAPQDGYVVHRSVQDGQLVQPDQTLMAITQSELWVVANFKETQIERLKAGQKVDIYVDAYPSAVFHGRVDSFQAGTGSRFSILPAENASGNFVKVVQRIPVKIVFETPPDTSKYLLVPGMSVVPKVHTK